MRSSTIGLMVLFVLSMAIGCDEGSGGGGAPADTAEPAEDVVLPPAGSGAAWDEVNALLGPLLDATRQTDIGILNMLRGGDATNRSEDDGYEATDDDATSFSQGLMEAAVGAAALQEANDALSAAMANALGKADMVWALNQLVNKKQIDEYINDKLGDFGEELTGTSDDLAYLMYEYWIYVIENSVNGTQEWDDLYTLNCILAAELKGELYWEDGSKPLGKYPELEKEKAKNRALEIRNEVLGWEPHWIIVLHHEQMCLPTYLVFAKPFIQDKMKDLVKKGGKFYFDTVMNTAIDWWGWATDPVGEVEGKLDGYSDAYELVQGLKDDAPMVHPADAVIFLVPDDMEGRPMLTVAVDVQEDQATIPGVFWGDYTAFVFSRGCHPLVGEVSLTEASPTLEVSGFQPLEGVPEPRFTATPGTDGKDQLTTTQPSCDICQEHEYVFRQTSETAGESPIVDSSWSTEVEFEFDLSEGPETVLQIPYEVQISLQGKLTEDGEQFEFIPGDFILSGIVQWTIKLVDEGDETCWALVSELLEDETRTVATKLHSDGQVLDVSEEDFTTFGTLGIPMVGETIIGCGLPPHTWELHDATPPEALPVVGTVDHVVTIEPNEDQ